MDGKHQEIVRCDEARISRLLQVAIDSAAEIERLVNRYKAESSAAITAFDAYLDEQLRRV